MIFINVPQTMFRIVETVLCVNKVDIEKVQRDNRAAVLRRQSGIMDKQDTGAKA